MEYILSDLAFGGTIIGGIIVLGVIFGGLIAFEDLYEKFEEVQTLTTGSLKEVQELCVNRNTIQKEKSWKLT